MQRRAAVAAIIPDTLLSPLRSLCCSDTHLSSIRNEVMTKKYTLDLSVAVRLRAPQPLPPDNKSTQWVLCYMTDASEHTRPHFKASSAFNAASGTFHVQTSVFLTSSPPSAHRLVEREDRLLQLRIPAEERNISGFNAT